MDAAQIILLSAILAFPLILLIRYILKDRRRRILLSTPLPEKYVRIIEKNIRPYARLSETMKKELQGLVNIFLEEKTFEGCGGLEITDEIRVTIAAEACLLLLNKNVHECFPSLHNILVYPGAYVAQGKDIIAGRVVEGATTVRAGESWQNGEVVLSWDHVKHGIMDAHDGHNVVHHEIGHQLDQHTGAANGAPPLKTYHTWALVMGHDFKELCEKVMKHKKDVIDAYGATNPAEFFAVATEVFFEKPEQLKRDHPEMFEQLEKYYKVNPTEWV
jgi:Mlc titration factor MtfA (ptsG expression regulator)